jgi:hypothetical protein
MPVLVAGRPLEQREPVLVVQNRFEPGVHRFSLVVVDDRGLESEPDVIAVSVRRPLVIEPLRPPIVDTRIDPVINPVLIDPIVRPRSAARKGKKHGPE